MIRCRNSGGYGGRLLGIVDSSPHRGTMSTEAGQLHSETSKVTAKELETLARINPPLNLEASHLPTIERAARDSIDKETTKQILRSTGVDLEFNMVSSQLAAMNYAAHLARSLAVVETNPRRKEFLQRTDRKFSDLHGQVYKILFTRYQR